MWPNGSDTGHTEHSPDRGDPGIDRLLTVGLVFAVIAVVASTLPLALVAPVMSELLGFAAFAAMIVAAARRDDLFAGHVTAWDQAAMLLFLSLLIGLFVDAGAASKALHEVTVQMAASRPA